MSEVLELQAMETIDAAPSHGRDCDGDDQSGLSLLLC
ncbi:MAG: SapB/AmfS family lantipeptide [Pseudonocardiaceae bacterium]|nr:SapB/AmfS family lantipeptide [Pseudonocardiaceae bacterium]